MQSARKRMLSDQRPLKVAGWGPDPNLAGTISVGDIYHLIAGARPIGRAVRTLGRNERTWRRTVQWDLNDVRILIIVRYQESSVGKCRRLPGLAVPHLEGIDSASLRIAQILATFAFLRTRNVHQQMAAVRHPIGARSDVIQGR